MKRNYLFIFVATIFLIGCANQSDLSSTVPAPVVDGVAAQSSNSALRDYRVRVLGIPCIQSLGVFLWITMIWLR